MVRVENTLKSLRITVSVFTRIKSGNGIKVDYHYVGVPIINGLNFFLGKKKLFLSVRLK